MSLFHKVTTELKLYSTRATWRFFLPDYSVCLPVLSLCKPWDGTLYIDLRSLRARHEDWIFIKQFSNYKSFLCLLVKNFRNYFNWRKFLKKLCNSRDKFEGGGGRGKQATKYKFTSFFIGWLFQAIDEMYRLAHWKESTEIWFVYSKL